MRRLLTDYNCDPNITDFYGELPLIQYAVVNYKDESFKMMVKLCKHKLNVNLLDKDNMGRIQYFVDQATFDLLHFLYREMPNALDIHNPCFDHYGVIVSPITKFIVEFEVQNYHDMISREEFKLWFLDDQFTI